jgi:hypothetical protein
MFFSSWLRPLHARRQLPLQGHARSRKRGKRQRRFRLDLERLEDRTVLSAPYVVNTTADSGPGSLRDAINQINADTNHALYASPSNPSVDEIDFAITAVSDAAGGGTGYNATTGVATITPQLGLPTLANAVLIDGQTQAGASPNTLAQGDNAILKIQLNLSGISPAYGVGLRVNADNCIIRGLVFNGLTVDIPAIGVGGTSDHIERNFIGTDVTGTQVAGNTSWGIQLFGSNEVVGGTTPNARNIISGNGNGPSSLVYDEGGISVGGTGNRVEGNYIGTDLGGTKALGNGSYDVGGHGGFGVNLGGEVNATTGNLISGNSGGINVGGATGACIQGNLIGTDVTGRSALGNTRWGILDEAKALIGGTTAAARNIISGNPYGIEQDGAGSTIEGNYIGTDITGTQGLGNTVAGLFIRGGISVGGTGPGVGNVISGNNFGVLGQFDGNVIEGNLIGTDYTGTKAIGNVIGINFQFGNNNLIGGLDTNAPGAALAGAGNVISADGQGVVISNGSGNVVEGNYIGTDILWPQHAR